MEPNKAKEGVSIKEIERFAKKHSFEVFFCLSFIFACFFSFIFFGAGLAVFFAAIGGILGVLFPLKIESLFRKVFQFIFKQESAVQLVLGGAALIISIFLPPVIFLMLGTQGGRMLYMTASETSLKGK